MFNYFHFNVAIPRKEIELFKNFITAQVVQEEKKMLFQKNLLCDCQVCEVCFVVLNQHYLDQQM